ncbi:S8 family serine peptidase [Foetidibacter luteolus]|uniref:S8 family serine peptidase n=1 Tax=Foetidibacter luteolus TaxID=2608880 RepID=UPI00129BB5C4|nr:S8 family serine peptidase [Foetidibacter luteolus]
MTKRLLYAVAGFCCAAFIYSCKKDISNFDAPPPGVLVKKEDRSFIVIAKEGSDLKAIGSRLAAIGAKKFKIKESLEELSLINVVTPDPSFPEKARKIEGVESVVVNVTLNMRLPEKVQVSKYKVERSSAQPNAKAITDPLSVLQWGLKSVNVQPAWNKGYKGKKALVAVLDGGFFLNDPEIAPAVIGAKSFVDGEAAQFAGEGFSHGTHVAGTIAAAADGFGVVGVAPEAKLLLVKVLGDNGFGSYASIINGILYGANRGANVINMSLGGYLPVKTFIDDNGTPNDPSDDYVIEFTKDIKDLIKAINRATLYAKLRGSVLIAAAGNDGVDLDKLKEFNYYPAQAVGVLAIASNGPWGWAYNQDTTLFRPSAFTNYGKTVVAFGAPGGNYNPNEPFDATIVDVYGYLGFAEYFGYILSTGYYEGGFYYYTWSSGTSMAAPHASAVAALISGKYGGRVSPVVVDLILGLSAKDLGARGKDPFFGYGQVNAGKAVTY